MKHFSLFLFCFILFTSIFIDVTVSQFTITAQDLKRIRQALAVGTNNNTILDATEFVNRVLQRTTRTTTSNPNDNEQDENEEDAEDDS